MINTPQENPNIPSELSKKLDGVKNQITLGQADINYLRYETFI